MIGSVRGRLTLSVALVVGGLGVAAALVAPRAVRTALIDDRLDGEVAREAEALDAEFVFTVLPGQTIGSPELTAVFGPQIAGLTEALEGTGALDELRSHRSDGLILVTPTRGVVATVAADGLRRVDAVDRAPSGPLVTVDRLERLAIGLEERSRYDTPLDLLADETLTFDDLMAGLDEWFGTDIGERLDTSGWADLPGFDLGDEQVPPEIYEFLQDELFPDRDLRPVAPASTVDDFVFGVRSVGGIDVIVTASSDGIERSVDRVRDGLWLAVPILMLLAGGLTWLLAGRALRPVRAITEQTGRIRSSTLHERVPVPGSHDEIAGLATEMNTMLDRVQREDDRRRQFVADASHELRSPIAAIRTQAEAALATSVDDDASELATGVLAEAERLGTVVDDLLSLARHDEALAAPGTVLDLDDLVLADARRPRRVPVDVSNVSAGQVRGRPEELARVVTHLLDNAARHARERVAVSLDTDEHGQVRLTVDDDGPGVPLEDRSRIFERFVRLDEARERDRGGAGLGLAVVAGVVTAAGGSVSVDDSELGGARFAVVFPPPSAR